MGMGPLSPPSRSPRRDLGVIAPYTSIWAPPRTVPQVPDLGFLLPNCLFLTLIEMGDQEKACGELVGVKVNEMAVKCGGRQWALKTYGEHAETAIVVGEIISWQQGARAAFDKYIVEWDDGDEEVVALDQVRRIMQNNPGTAATALPSSVNLLTAASCYS